MHSQSLRPTCALLGRSADGSLLLRVCKAGEPCITSVKAARIRLSRTLARSVFVVPATA